MPSVVVIVPMEGPPIWKRRHSGHSHLNLPATPLSEYPSGQDCQVPDVIMNRTGMPTPNSPSTRALRMVPSPGRDRTTSASGCCSKWVSSFWVSSATWAFIVAITATAAETDDHAKCRKNYAGTSPITRASGTRRVVLAPHVRNKRLADAISLLGLCIAHGLTRGPSLLRLSEARGRHPPRRPPPRRQPSRRNPPRLSHQSHYLQRDHCMGAPGGGRTSASGLTVRAVGCLEAEDASSSA